MQRQVPATQRKRCMYLVKSVVYLEEVDGESGDLLTEANALQHGWCDEGDDKVASALVSPGVKFGRFLFLLHPVCACADRCA
jgi:hypothetical protein